MHHPTANAPFPLPCWLRVRHFAVPPSAIETATARRAAGDWAGACAAASVDVDLDLRSTARRHGRDLTTRLKADLRHLAPDLLRWHMPRVAPDGLLRPGLTLSLARYERGDERGRAAPLHLVVRTPPAWADAGQRFSLALWDAAEPDAGAGAHPHPRPSRRFRLDLHRHLWDARRAGELGVRSGAVAPPGAPPPAPVPEALARMVRDLPCATDRWAAEAALLLRTEGRAGGRVAVRYGIRQWLVLESAGGDADDGHDGAARITAVSAAPGSSALPVLPDAATWVLPDLALLRAGLIGAGELHPLVASALAPGRPAGGPLPDRARAGGPRLVDCRGARHRIGLVDGVLAPLDHDPDEIRREELLASLSGTPLPCLQAIDAAHRHPECLDDVRARLDHGDTAGALAVVEALLGPDAVPRHGALRDELEAALRRRIAHGLYRAGLAGPARLRGPVPHPSAGPRRRLARSRTRHGTFR